MDTLERSHVVTDSAILYFGTPVVPERQQRWGYTHVADKFGVSGLTPVPADLIAPPLVADCPVVMECMVDAMHPGEDRLPAVEVTVRPVPAGHRGRGAVPGADR